MNKKAKKAKKAKTFKAPKPIKPKHLIWNPDCDPDADPALPSLNVLTSQFVRQLNPLIKKQEIAKPTWHYRFAVALQGQRGMGDAPNEIQLLCEALPHVPINQKIREQLQACSAKAQAVLEKHQKALKTPTVIIPPVYPGNRLHR